MKFTDILNTNFDKSDIYRASLCETSFTKEKFSITYLEDVVGAYNGVFFLDFSSGNMYSTIEINKDAKDKPVGKYVATLTRVYDKSGKIRPIDVLCDFKNTNVSDMKCVRKR